MRLLLDSHVLIWLLYEPERVSANAVKAIEDADSVAISVVSLWELALKHVKGKLAYTPDSLIRGAEALALEMLPLRNIHISKLPDVQLPQSDPFDRCLVAQCEAEGMSLMTADRLLLKSVYQTVATTS